MTDREPIMPRRNHHRLERPLSGTVAVLASHQVRAAEQPGHNGQHDPVNRRINRLIEEHRGQLGHGPHKEHAAPEDKKHGFSDVFRVTGPPHASPIAGRS
jgi:hypothetical protein